MPTIEKCKKILEKNGETYTSEEVEKIKKLLYDLADLEFDNYKLKNNEKESPPLH